MKIYVAGSWLRRKELAKKAQRLEDEGIQVTSRWLSSHGDDLPLVQAAKEDLEDIRKADGLLLFTQDKKHGYTTGGRFVELGYAYAKKKTIVIVGPRENVFCHLDYIHQFNSFKAALEYLKGA